MSKTWRTILILALAAVILGGALLLLSEPAEDDGGKTEPENTALTLVDVKAADKDTAASLIKSVTITSPAGSFTVVAGKNGTLTVKDFEDLEPNTALFDSLSEALTQITATKLVTKKGKAKDFGFNKPQASFDITYSNGETRAFEFGAEEPYGTGDYFRFAGETAVYLVDTAVLDTVSLEKNAYIRTALYAAPDATATDPGQTAEAVLRDVALTGSFYGDSGLSLRMTGNDDNEDFLYTNYVITKPFVRCSDSSVLGDSFISSTSLTADIAVVPRYTKADLKQYGLADPYVVAKLHTAAQVLTQKTDKQGSEVKEVFYKNVEAHTVSVSKPDASGYVYLTVDEYPSIYRMSGAVLPWFEMTYDKCVSPLLFLRAISSAEQVIYTAGGKTTAFALTHHPEEEESDDQLEVTADGKPVDTGNFRSLYQVMMGLSRTGEADRKPSGKPAITLEVRGGGDPIKVNIYQQSASVYLAENGGDVYKLTASRVRNLQRQVENLLAGREVTTSA